MLRDTDRAGRPVETAALRRRVASADGVVHRNRRGVDHVRDHRYHVSGGLCRHPVTDVRRDGMNHAVSRQGAVCDQREALPPHVAQAFSRQAFVREVFPDVFRQPRCASAFSFHRRCV